MYQTFLVDCIALRLKKWHMCHFFSPERVILPLIILDEPIEKDVAVPASLVGILAYLSVICLLSIRNMLDMQVDTSWILLVHNLWYR